MAKKDKKPKAAARPALPAQLLDMVEGFLSENSFKNAHEAFQKQRAKSGLKASSAKPQGSLVAIYQTWETSQKPVAEKVAKDSSSDSSDSSDSDSSSSEADVDMADADSSDSSSSSSDSDSDSSDSEDEAPAKVAVPAKNLKRKAPSESSDSSSSDSSDSDSSSDKKPRQIKKKLKTVDIQ